VSSRGEVTVRKLGVVLIGVVLAVAACGDDDDDEGASATTTAETSASAEASAGLEGTWETGPVTIEEMTTTLREQGLGKWVDKFEQNAPISADPTVLILEVGNGTWDLYGQPEGGNRKPIDYNARSVVEGDTVEVIHADGSNTHQWAVDGDVLDLAWLRGNLPAYRGIPDEVFQRALYMTSDFERS
jgi:hypothetical protein